MLQIDGAALLSVGSVPGSEVCTDDVSISMAGAAAAPSSAAYLHEALLYRGQTDFVEQVLPCVVESIEQDEPVLVAVPEPKLELLRAALGLRHAGVHFADMAVVGRNPARMIPVWRSFVALHRGAPCVRGIGENAYAERPPDAIAECMIHESLLNLAFDPATPLRLSCAYDVSVLPEHVLDDVRRSHPFVRTDKGTARSGEFGSGTDATKLFERALPPAPGDALRLPFGSADILSVRAAVSDLGRRSGLAGDRLDALVLSVHELVVNSIRHGGGEGVLSAWRAGTGVVVEVSDRGHLADPLAGSVAPPGNSIFGRGLWIANQLCDLLQICSSATGTSVRVTVGP
jgi:anti-sigma regulatory factor (Ser/Thr protein kinase)